MAYCVKQHVKESKYIRKFSSVKSINKKEEILRVTKTEKFKERIFKLHRLVFNQL